MSKKVVLGMSGGVDSSVAAYILKKQGYEVIGITMKIWEDDNLEKSSSAGCCGLSAINDARNVAERLEIPYYVLNFKDDFKKNVIDYFVNEYKEGKTPNPCIACNKFIKWEALLNKSIQLGADYIATGHYANIVKYNGRYSVKMDPNNSKDQSYALYNLTQFQLERTLMPIGQYTKEEVRKIATEIGLSVANKPDSQEICFIPDNDYGAFIKNNTKEEIKKIDPLLNEITLSEDEELYSDILYADKVNCMGLENFDKKIKAFAKIRYSHKPEACTIIKESEKLKIVFDEPQRAITSGQAVVLYNNDGILLAGGTIL